MGAELFVMVRGDDRIWRMAAYDEHTLLLEGPAPALEHTVVNKSACRVGEAKHWRCSRFFSNAWYTGGGELFK